MDESRFRHALRIGLGRAILYARSHDVSPFGDAILDACLHCQSYDIQVDGTRASYMYDLVGALPDRDFYYEAVLKSLPECGDDWDAAQRFHFAACLAFDGSERARRALYDHYRPGPRMGELIAIDFLKMDGVAGLLFVAEKMGALLLANPAGVDSGYLLSQSLEICGEQATWDALRDAGAANASIDAFRSVAMEQHRRWKRTEIQSPEIASLRYEQLQELPSNTPYLFWKWGEQASEEELELAARGLIAARDPQQQLAHLRIFARRRFPLDVQPILDLVDVEQDRVGRAAMKALEHVAHPLVRALAFRLVDTHAGRRGDAIALLSRNFQDGDHRIVLRWFLEEEDPEALHSMGTDLLEFWKRHPDEETSVPRLRALYEKGPCSFCRKSSVERMLERGALTGELRAECAWDANDEIRELMGTPPQA